MDKEVDKLLWDMFKKTGDPLYFTTRSILRDKNNPK